MSDSKKYYYMKIKEDFFESEDIKILQSMPDGYLFSDILMKIYLKSLKFDGKLMFKDHIPYNANMIATVTNHSVTIVEKALNIFKELGLIEVLDNGAIYMLDIQNFIGRSSTEADRKREYRNKIEEEKKLLLDKGQMSRQNSDNPPPENRDRDRDIQSATEVVSSNELLRIISAWNELGLTKLVSLKPNSNRYKLLQTRIKEYGIEEVIRAIENIKSSSFLKGQNNRSWTITFDWLVKPNNFIKVLEGNYDDKNPRPTEPTGTKFNNFPPREYDYDSLEKGLLGWDKDDE